MHEQRRLSPSLVATAFLVTTLLLARRYIVALMAWPLLSSSSCRWWFFALFALSFAVVRHKRARGHAVDAIDGAVVGWLGALALASLHADDGRVPWAALVPYALPPLVLATRLRPLALPPLRDAVVVTVLLVASTALLDAYGWWRWQSLERPGGLLVNRNYVGEYLAITLPICLWRARDRSRWLLPLLGLVLALTRCRTAWIAAAIAGGVLLVAAADGASRRRLVAGTLWAGAGALVAGALPARLHWSEPDPMLATLARLLNVQTGSGALRLQQYVQTARLLAHDWLRGAGPGQWSTLMRRNGLVALARNWRPQSEFVRAFSDGGVLALAALLALLLLLTVAAWRARRTAPDAVASAVALMVVCATDTPLYRLESATLVFLFLAAASRSSPAAVLAGCPSDNARAAAEVGPRATAGLA